MSEQINEELMRLYGIRLTESDPREFAKYHRLVGFDLGEVFGFNALISKFVSVPYPIHQGFYGADIAHESMCSSGVLGWRVPSLQAEIAVVKYEEARTWLGRVKCRYALFVKHEASCYLWRKGMESDVIAPLLVRALNGLRQQA